MNTAKRILAGIIAACTITTSALAFTPYGPEEAETAPESTAEENAHEAENESASVDDISQGNPAGMVQQITPRDIQYQMFEQILDAYVEKHLYDFTEEQVLHKFFEDFLVENPMYFQLFTKYLLGTMDPYSSYYESSSNFLNPESESFGFGFTIADRGDGVYIESVLPYSHAKEAGFAAGDRFVSVAGINVEKQSFDVVTAILAKPQSFLPKEAENTADKQASAPVNAEEAEDVTGTESTSGAEITEAAPAVPEQPEIEIIIDRNGEKLTFTLSKGPMELSQITSAVKDNDDYPTAFIQVSSFLGDNTDKEFIDLVKKYAQDGIKHLTIDLRNNGGGSLDYALSMAEIFVGKGEIISYYDDKSLEEPQPIYSTEEKISFDSIVILINEKTASAAELFTSILQDKGLAKVVGKKSYGKSLGQEVYTLANGDMITITTYQMLNEKLESYDGKGIIPDITIDDVEICFMLPELGVFNHQNFVEIKEGEYSDTAKALEDRMEIMGILREEYCDGIFDDVTKTALLVLQTDHGLNATGYVDYETVSLITRIINSYKPHTYLDNTQYDVAMIIHHSFSQGKRLAKERERLRSEQAELIKERDAALEAAHDAANAPADEAAKAESTENTESTDNTENTENGNK